MDEQTKKLKADLLAGECLQLAHASLLLQNDEARTIRLWWWLRTPGFDNSFAATVTPDGAVVRIGSFVDTDDYAVRPAMWIQTDTYSKTKESYDD